MWRAGLAGRAFDRQRRSEPETQACVGKASAGDELYHNTKASFTRATVVSCWSVPRLTQERMT